MDKNTTLTSEDYAALRFRSMHGSRLVLGRSQFAGNNGDVTDYRAMRSCVEAMRCSLPASRVQIETNQNAGPHETAEYLLNAGRI